jgi:dTDP-4-dehydrorhamnose 3,5-epimerase
MKILSVQPLAIPDVKVIRFVRFIDDRGYFTEPYRKSELHGYPELNELFDVKFVQINESFSKLGVCRGLHFQWNPFMGKLVRTIYGHMVDLVLDIRKGSPTLGKILAYNMPTTLADDFGEWIWVPPGFAHGNFFLQETRIEYLCSGEYSPKCEAGISPLSEDLDWSLCHEELKILFDATVRKTGMLSEKDQNGFSLNKWLKDTRSNNFIFGVC